MREHWSSRRSDHLKQLQLRAVGHDRPPPLLDAILVRVRRADHDLRMSRLEGSDAVGLRALGLQLLLLGQAGQGDRPDSHLRRHAAAHRRQRLGVHDEQVQLDPRPEEVTKSRTVSASHEDGIGARRTDPLRHHVPPAIFALGVTTGLIAEQLQDHIGPQRGH